MTTPSNKSKDNIFNSFAVGVTVGIGAALLFGTEEGRTIAKRILSIFPQSILPSQSDNKYLSPEPQETIHSATYKPEPPPPVLPYVRPTKPFGLT